MAALIIPTNGFAGAAQQTPAVRNHLNVAMGGKSAARSAPKRKRAAGAKSTVKTKTKRKPKGATILVAGSAAAKAWGKKMAAAKKKAAKAAA